MGKGRGSEDDALVFPDVGPERAAPMPALSTFHCKVMNHGVCDPNRVLCELPAFARAVPSPSSVLSPFPANLTVTSLENHMSP